MRFDLLKRGFLSLSLISLSLLCVGCSASSGAKILGKQAPLTRLTMLNSGEMISSDTLKQPLVLAFWATTCKSSPRAIEKLNSYADELADRGVSIVAISIDKSEAFDDVKAMIKYREIDQISHAFSGNDVYDEAYISFDGSKIPYFVIIDQAGTVVQASHTVESILDYFHIER